MRFLRAVYRFHNPILYIRHDSSRQLVDTLAVVFAGPSLGGGLVFDCLGFYVGGTYPAICLQRPACWAATPRGSRAVRELARQHGAHHLDNLAASPA